MNVALVRHLMGASGVHGNLERHLKRGSAPAPRDGVCLRIVRQARIEEPGSLHRAHIFALQLQIRLRCCSAKSREIVSLGVDTSMSARLYTRPYGAPSALHGATSRLRSSSLAIVKKASDRSRRLEASTAFQSAGKRGHHGPGLFDK